MSTIIADETNPNEIISCRRIFLKATARPEIHIPETPHPKSCSQAGINSDEGTRARMVTLRMVFSELKLF